MVMKTLTEARENFENSTPYIPERYKSGVLKADWQPPAGSEVAEKNFAGAMGEVITKKLRQAGGRNLVTRNGRIIQWIRAHLS